MREIPWGVALCVMSVLVAVVPLQAEGQETPWPPSGQTPGIERYWETRQIVTIAAYRSESGRLDSTVVVRGLGRAAAIDSARILLTNWMRTHFADTAAQDRRTFALCNVALDPLALGVPGHEAWHLPPFAGDVLGRPGFRDWLDALRREDSSVVRESFLATVVGRLGGVPGPGLLHHEQMQLKQAAGLLSSSPDGRYVLDPFEGMELDTAYGASFDVDLGYAVYDGASGDRLFYLVSTDSRNDLGAWVDNRHFILAGTIRLLDEIEFRGSWNCTLVPAILIGDVEEEINVLYLGAPLPDCEEAAFGKALDAVRARAYPKVDWNAY